MNRSERRKQQFGTTAAPPTTLPPASAAAAPAAMPKIPTWVVFPGAPLFLTFAFLLFALLPRVQSNPRMLYTYLGVGAGLLLWQGALALAARRTGRVLGFEPAPPVKAHYVQASVQICLYIYWGWYWRDVYTEAPLIVSQFVFLYCFDALLTWTRGRNWRLGFGPLPIILSTNVFIWFVDDLYFFQFALVALGAIGKEFVKWNRDGRRTHIVNPSAFTLAIFSVVLLATNTTGETYAQKIASSISYPPYIYAYVFVLGLIVQYFFNVTLVTFAAVATVVVLNEIWWAATGTYFFVFWNLPVPIFVGLTLLVTDPSTSPRTNIGKALFGAAYGASSFALSGILNYYHLPTVYDKLLPIPVLNLTVQALDRFAKWGPLGNVTAWEMRHSKKTLNLAHMACWSALFFALLSGGYLSRAHEGNNPDFWKKAIAEGRPGAGNALIELWEFNAREGSGTAWDELGLIHMEGKLVPKDPSKAQRCFARATKLGDVMGSLHLADMFLAVDGARAGNDVNQAFDQLERASAESPNGRISYLVAYAYELGRGRAQNKARAMEYYDQGCKKGDAQSCASLARLRS